MRKPRCRKGKLLAQGHTATEGQKVWARLWVLEHVTTLQKNPPAPNSLSPHSLTCLWLWQKTSGYLHLKSPKVCAKNTQQLYKSR